MRKGNGFSLPEKRKSHLMERTNTQLSLTFSFEVVLGFVSSANLSFNFNQSNVMQTLEDN